jgi:hypothetical protein
MNDNFGFARVWSEAERERSLYIKSLFTALWSSFKSTVHHISTRALTSRASYPWNGALAKAL